MSYAKAVGGVLKSVMWDADDIILEMTTGTLTLHALGDCCSNSWFDSVDSDAVGGALTEIDLQTGTIEDHPQYDVLETRFGVVKTTKGRVTFTMYNSSNGYYGGYLSYTWIPAE